MSYNTVSLSKGDGSVQQFNGGGGSSSASTASAVSYNNNVSGLAATNVQDAIDELAETPAGSTAVLNITTTSTEFYGQTITVSNSENTYTGKFSSSGQATIYISNLGTYTVSCQTSSTTVTIAAIGAVYSIQLELLYATINVTCINSELFGQDLTISFGGSEVGTIPIDSEGNGTYRATQLGTYTISYTGQPSATAKVTSFNTTVSVIFGIAIATFAAATEQQIADMVAAADAGLIDLYEDAGWRVGQTRTVQLSAIAASGTYDGVSWDGEIAEQAQSIQLVLIHRGLYTLVNPVLNKDGTQRTTCSFVCGVKDCLLENRAMRGNGNIGSWPGTRLRNWCNGGFRSSLPETLRSCFKQFNTITGMYHNDSSTGGTNVISQDYFTFAAEKEVLGSKKYSTDNEANALTQFTHYQSAANRVKQNGYNGGWWWNRSPIYGGSAAFCSTFGGSNSVTANYTANGISPFGCL